MISEAKSGEPAACNGQRTIRKVGIACDCHIQRRSFHPQATSTAQQPRGGVARSDCCALWVLTLRAAGPCVRWRAQVGVNELLDDGSYGLAALLLPLSPAAAESVVKERMYGPPPLQPVQPRHRTAHTAPIGDESLVRTRSHKRTRGTAATAVHSRNDEPLH